MNQAGSLPDDGSLAELNAENETVAPGAGVLLASIGPLTVGTWHVRVMAGYSQGAPVPATETRNIQVQLSGSVLWILPVPGVANRMDTFEFHLNVPVALNGGSLSTQAIAAATAGVAYMTQLNARKIRGGFL